MAEMAPSPTRFKAAGPLRGRVRVPGDKSISHRALMLSAVAHGTSRIEGMLEGEDVLATAAALRAMGAEITREAEGGWVVHGAGLAGLRQPAMPLDMGNSGTSTRLLMGLLAGRPFPVRLVGDASLSRRPMARVADPLRAMGAAIEASAGDRLPLTLHGTTSLRPIDYRLPVASAQVKSAILLAALSAHGTTRIVEPERTRDHSERMLRGFGATISVEERDGARLIAVSGGDVLAPCDIVVPGDPSSAAFFIVAALLVPGSDLLIENVGINPTRAGLIGVLRAMSGRIEYVNEREVGGEPVADLRVQASPLAGIDVDPDVVPSMIDEFPVFFVAAAAARGRTTAWGLGELRVKESDRLSLMAQGLARLGVALDERPDSIAIEGLDGRPFGSVTDVPVIAADLDHRIAMSFAVAGLTSHAGVAIDDMSPVATSFPGFEATLRASGALA